MDRNNLIAEGASWLVGWLEKADPSFKDVSLVLIFTSKPELGTNSSDFDMVSNESNIATVAMLLAGLNQAIQGDNPNRVRIELPKAKQQ